MIVMKFGGSSVANLEAITRTIFIVGSKLHLKPVVVVSALSGVTDLLFSIADAAKLQNAEETNILLNQLRERHIKLVAELLAENPSLHKQAEERVSEICNNLSELANAACTLGELSNKNKATIISTGEYLSSTIICHAMNARGIRTNLVDARDMIITNGNYLKAEPKSKEIVPRVQEIISKAYEGADAVITQGFVGMSKDGEPTVLGRGGSDYSASLIGMALEAEQVEIWTDVDGVRTADPRYIQGTKYLEKISFEEAAEMAHFGAKILHPLTIEPAVKNNMPIYVLNSMNPSSRGTAILNNEMIEDGVKSVSFKKNIQVINIFSLKMINTSGFLRRVFEIFSESKISVDLISTSEANISVTVDASQNIDKVVEELSEFADVIVDTDKSQVSVIGKNIVKLNGVLKRTFAPLKGCKIYMISQGASYVNISFVIDREGVLEAVQELHDYLFYGENEDSN